ncbi:MAG: DHH family phosphoesterase, partial [Bacteroidales bacterium]|nr:DHH family phosphoesterase [Candidatus Colimorpha onthohippi]
MINQSAHVVIVSHTNADGDAMGSALGMRHVLERNGQHCTVMLPNGCPKVFSWMPQSESILCGDSQIVLCKKAIDQADLILGIDFNQLSRIDCLSEIVRNAAIPKILIDHHHAPNLSEFDLVLSEPDLSSACELCHWITVATFGKEIEDSTIATCYYTGISTDTGGFAYSCNRSSVFEAAAELVGLGIDAADIHNKICNTFSIDRMQLWGFAISQRLRIFPEQKFAYFYFSQQDLQQYAACAEDVEGLVNYTLMMQQIEVGCLIREETNRVKVSMRSKADVDVRMIAQTYFDGGGHTKAAGATSTMPLNQTIAKVEEIFLNLHNVKKHTEPIA